MSSDNSIQKNQENDKHFLGFGIESQNNEFEKFLHFILEHFESQRAQPLE